MTRLLRQFNRAVLVCSLTLGVAKNLRKAKADKVRECETRGALSTLAFILRLGKKCFRWNIFLCLTVFAHTLKTDKLKKKCMSRMEHEPAGCETRIALWCCSCLDKLSFDKVRKGQ